MPADKISLAQAKPEKLFYFVANVVIYRPSDQRCLILKRSGKEKVHPGKYCVPGGKLEWRGLDLTQPTRVNGEVLDFENAVEDLITREVAEEAGLEIFTKPLYYINSNAFVRPDGIPVVLVKFAARYKSGEIKLSSDFSVSAWVDAEDVKQYDCILGVPEEVKKTIELFAGIV